MYFINFKNSTHFPHHHMADTSLMKKVLEEIKREEDLKRKKKKPIELRKEKRLMYYSGWHKDDKPVDKVKGDIQKKL